MKKRLQLLLAFVVLIPSAMAQAQMVDLPNPFDDGPLPPPPLITPAPAATPSPTVTPTPAPTPRRMETPKPSPSPVATPARLPEKPQVKPTPYYDSIIVENITRKTGGAWYVINFSSWVTLSSLHATAYYARIKVHDAFVIDKNLRRIKIEVNPATEFLSPGQPISIPSATALGPIYSLHLRLESYGGVASLAAEMGLGQRVSLTYQVQQEKKPEATASSGNCRRGSNFVQAIAPWEQEMLQSGSRAANYYGGSPEYNAYTRRAQNAADKITQYARASNLAGATTQQLQNWGAQYASRAQNYYGGSLEHNTYSMLSNLFYSQVAKANDDAQACSPQSLEQLLRNAAAYASKARNYYGGSTEYNTYTRESQKLYALAVARYKNEVRAKDSSQLNREMLQYEGHARNFYGGSVEYNTYSQMAATASWMAQRKYAQEVLSKSTSQRRREAAQFEMASRNYYGGSTTYNHYVALARIALYGG